DRHHGRCHRQHARKLLGRLRGFGSQGGAGIEGRELAILTVAVVGQQSGFGPRVRIGPIADPFPKNLWKCARNQFREAYPPFRRGGKRPSPPGPPPPPPSPQRGGGVW